MEHEPENEDQPLNSDNSSSMSELRQALFEKNKKTKERLLELQKREEEINESIKNRPSRKLNKLNIVLDSDDYEYDPLYKEKKEIEIERVKLLALTEPGRQFKKRQDRQTNKADIQYELIIILPPEEELERQKKELENQGYEVKNLDDSIIDILSAVKNRKKIGGINIAEKLQDPKFRFLSSKDLKLSRELADALSAQTQYTKSLLAQNASKEGVKKRNKLADEFAIKMYDVIKKIKTEEKISSFKETVEALNRKKIPTFRNGKDGEWYVSALQNLQKRWKDLGLLKDHKPK